MLTFELNKEPTNIQQTICYVRKSPIFQSHKSYKNTLKLYEILNFPFRAIAPALKKNPILFFRFGRRAEGIKG